MAGRYQTLILISVVQSMRTLEFKLYPTVKQIAVLNSWLKACCWLQNKTLEKCKKSYERRKDHTSLYDNYKFLTHLRNKNAVDIPCKFGRDPIKRIDLGMKAFFRRLKSGGSPGFPKFKSNRFYTSLRCENVDNYFRNGKIRIPKLGYLRYRGVYTPQGQQKLITIIKKPNGWFAQVVVDTVVNKQCGTKDSIGIDLGIDNLLALSNGEEIKSPKFLEKSLDKLKRLDRKISKCELGSNNKKKLYILRAKLYNLIKSQRKTYLHKLTTRLANKYKIIVVENLDIKNMVEKSKFGSRFRRNILDSCWGIFVQLLESKVNDRGGTLIKVDPAYTSQTCPKCGNIKEKKLSERTHECICGLSVSRDVASAQVILARGLGLAESKPQTDLVKISAKKSKTNRKKRELLSLSGCN